MRVLVAPNACVQHRVPPLLNDLQSLTRLALVETHISAVANLDRLVNLTHLDLTSSSVRDISALR